MHRFHRFVVVAAVALPLAACGRVASKVAVPPLNLPKLDQVKLQPAEVASKEQNADATALNEQWKKLAAEELQTMLKNKNVAIAPAGHYSVGCKIDAVYGNRALRYFVGYGAGSGHISVTVELRDSGGKVLYATSSEADLAVGSFGGDMADVVRNTIRAAATEFGSRL